MGFIVCFLLFSTFRFLKSAVYQKLDIFVCLFFYMSYAVLVIKLNLIDVWAFSPFFVKCNKIIETGLKELTVLSQKKVREKSDSCCKTRFFENRKSGKSPMLDLFEHFASIYVKNIFIELNWTWGRFLTVLFRKLTKSRKQSNVTLQNVKITCPKSMKWDNFLIWGFINLNFRLFWSSAAVYAKRKKQVSPG